jgi:perosamine synthetase
MSFRIDWPQRGHGFTEDEIAAVGEVMRSVGKPLTQGVNVKQFEDAFSAHIGVANAFATMSCAHALDIVAMLANVQPGDEVIIPAHTYCASALAFARRGAVIKWADIDPVSFTMAPESMRELVTHRTKVVVLVHLYGLLSPHVDEIATFAKERGIYLVEDCAQSLGAIQGSRHGGSFGDFGCFSFHAQKNLSTLGEGGMLTVRNPELAAKVPGLRLNGHVPFANKSAYWLPAMTNVDQDLEGVWPMKSTMTEVQAVVGRMLLGRLTNLTEQRRERGLAFRSAMANFPELEFQGIHRAEAHSHHLLPARFEGNGKTRDDLIRDLSTNFGIKAIVQYYPLNRYDLFRKMGLGDANVPETDRFFDNMISFPFSLEIGDEDFRYVIDSVKTSLTTLRGNN